VFVGVQVVVTVPVLLMLVVSSIAAPTDLFSAALFIKGIWVCPEIKVHD
jgi:hypothetical protein